MGNCCTVVVPSSSLNSKPSELGLTKCDTIKVLRIQRGFRKYIRAKLKRKEFYKKQAVFGYDLDSSWDRALNFSYSDLSPTETGLSVCLNRIRDFYYKFLSPYGFIGDFIVDLDDSADHDLEGNPILYKEFSECSLLNVKSESDFIKQFYFFILTFANTKFKLTDAPNLMFMANQQFVFRLLRKDSVLTSYMSKIKNMLERNNVLDDFLLYCLHYKIGNAKEKEKMARTSKSTDSKCSFDKFGLSSSSLCQTFNISKQLLN